MRTLFAALLAVLLLPALALAQEAPSSVTVPFGTWIADLAGLIGTALVGVILWALRRLPTQVYSILLTLRVDQLLAKAVDYGINSVKGATADKTLTVDVGVPVLAEALRYAVDKAPGWLVAWTGGPEALAEMIWARLKLPAEAGKPDFARVSGAV